MARGGRAIVGGRCEMVSMRRSIERSITVAMMSAVGSEELQTHGQSRRVQRGWMAIAGGGWELASVCRCVEVLVVLAMPSEVGGLPMIAFNMGEQFRISKIVH